MLPYKDWLGTLKVGDKIKAHYDGKAGRGCPGEVISRTDSGITVRFSRFGHPISQPKIVEVIFDANTGVGYDNSEDGSHLMQMLGVCEEGDYYRLGPM